MKKTVTERFFLSLCMLTLFSLFGGEMSATGTDVITASDLAATSNSYTNFSNVEKSSGAVYAGNSAKSTSGSIQLRSDKNNSGIVSTTSGGKVSKITLTWDSNTASGRTVNIYGKNAAYSSAADLYDSSKQGELLGTIVYGTSTELTIKGDYQYIGLRSNNGALYLTQVEIEWVAYTGKSDPALAFDQETYTTELNVPVTVNATATSTGDITYSVADTETDITVNATTGEVTATAAGTYTVKATIAETENYYGRTATCQVVVTPPSAHISPVTYYKKITSTEDIIDGSVFLIVNEEKGAAMSSSAGDYNYKVDATISSNTIKGITPNTTGNPYEVTVTKNEDGSLYLQTTEGYLYKPTTSSNYVRTAADKETATTWTCTIADGNVTLYSKNGTYEGYLRYNANSGTERFSCYSNATSVENIQLYQKVGELTVQKAVDGYATYVTDFAYRMPGTLTGKTVSAANADGSLTIDDAYAGLAEVPELTPLLIKTSDSYAADESQKTYYPVVLNKSLEAYTGSNLLEGWRALDGKTTQTKKEESVYYYKLALNSSNEPGFYWGADGGAAFEMQNGATAYLTVEQSILSGAEGFRLGFGGNTTAIEGASLESNESQPVYNLQGVRLNTKAGQLPRGLYIQGGKKVIIK